MCACVRACMCESERERERVKHDSVSVCFFFLHPPATPRVFDQSLCLVTVTMTAGHMITEHKAGVCVNSESLGCDLV